MQTVNYSGNKLCVLYRNLLGCMDVQLIFTLFQILMSCIMRKYAFRKCKNKVADQPDGSCIADKRLSFAKVI